MKSKIITLLVALFCVTFLRAEQVTLTNKQTDELCGALMRIGPGLSGVNAARATRAINALKPVVEAYAAGIEAAKQNHKITPQTKDDSPEAVAYLAELKRLRDEPQKIELTRFVISDEEFERLSANTPPVVTAVILQYLEPTKK